jgi:hypothetical protein
VGAETGGVLGVAKIESKDGVCMGIWDKDVAVRKWEFGFGILL